MVSEAMRARHGRALVLIDIAVPRDIDPDCRDIPHVKLFDIDGLNTQLEDSLTRRMNEVPSVKQILEEELAGFEGYLKSLDMLPIIADIRQRAEAIRLAELEKTLRRMPDLTDTERERIEALTQALVQKLLDHPTRRLRAEAASQQAAEYAALARHLFNLSEEQAPTSTAAD
jgi:glutamyl-tRNA reductase